MQDFAQGKVCPIPNGIETSPQHATFLKQLVRIMKLTAILLTMGLLQVHAAGFSQTVTFSGKDVPLEKVLTVIKQQTGYGFFYSAEQIHAAKKVTINVKNAAIEEVLAVCFKDQPFDYKIKENVIFIIKKQEPIKVIQTVLADRLKEVKGKIVNEAGEPVQASIIVKGTTNGTSTNINGEFTLINVDEDAILIISGVGIETFEMHVKGRASLGILNAQTKISENETVTINAGYYRTTERLKTGNISKIKSSALQTQPVSDPLLALEGRVPGLYIAQTSGIPGAYSTVRLRGQNSIANNNNPLYIVDGVPFTSTSIYMGGGSVGTPTNPANANLGVAPGGLSPFNNLNMADIESIEILKDADATAIYGSRGANGVILITTKKGKSGKTKFDIDISSGLGTITHMLPMMNTQQYLDMRREAFANDGKTAGVSDLDLNGTWDATSYTDWQKVLIGYTADFTNIQGALSGGNANTQFLVAGGYSKQTTVYPGNFYDQKASLNVNLSHVSFNKKFHGLFSGGYVKDNNKLPGSDITSSITIAPNAPSQLIDGNGNLIWTNIPFVNPFALLKRTANAITKNLISNLNLNYEIAPGLEAKASFGYTFIQLNQDNLLPASSFRPPATTRIHDRGTNDIETWIAEPQLNYTKRIKEGKLAVLIGTTFQENKQNTFSVEGSNFSSDDQIQNIALAPTITILANTTTLYHYGAIYGRINYEWKEKYLINVTGRRDGSTRFGPGNQFGNFGAVGAGWVFSEEKFVREHLSFLNYGKLRGSYGRTGNDQLLDYQYLSTYSPYNSSTYQGVIGLFPTTIPNPYYGWETVNKLEGGLELGFLQNRISLSVSYYRNRTANQLVGYALPSIDGFTSVIANLPAVIQNTGVEILLNAVNIKRKDFTWNSSFNISIPRNKLVSYPNLASSSYATVYKEGKSLFIQRRYHVTEVDPQTGLYTIEDVNSDGKIDANDRQFIKQIAQNYYGGFENIFSYKGFQLNVLFQFVKQTGSFYVSQYPGSFNGGSGNQPTFIQDRWQKLGDDSRFEKYTQQSGTIQQAFTNALGSSGDYSITDASFIRLKNLALSYQLPRTWLDKVHLNEARLFVQSQNLFTITNYNGQDPETQGKSLPPLRMINFGMHVSI